MKKDCIAEMAGLSFQSRLSDDDFMEILSGPGIKEKNHGF